MGPAVDRAPKTGAGLAEIGACSATSGGDGGDAGTPGGADRRTGGGTEVRRRGIGRELEVVPNIASRCSSSPIISG